MYFSKPKRLNRINRQDSRS